jgi:hypothetical protein
MVGFADLFTLPTRAEIKARIITFAEDALLPVTSWVLGDPSERWIEISARAIDTFLSNITTQAVRSMFFDLSTDPGDPGDLSADQTARPGWLSAFMSGWWGVQRGNATYAPGFLTVTNTGDTPATFSPFDLTFQRSTAGADGGKPTYRNTADDTIYAGLGGTLTLAPDASATIPILCEQIGTYGSATPGQITVVVTGSFGTLTCTNASPVLGSDREARGVAITRARQQSAAASPSGPSDAYRYACTTGADGNPLQLWNGGGATTVNRVYVSEASSTTAVTIYLANASGPASAEEVSSANGNIWGIEIIADDGEVYNVDPIGVAPDIATLGPTVADAVTGAPGPAAAVATNIGPLKGTARIKAVAGLASVTLIAAIHEANEAALSAFFASPDTAPIGGVDQTAGAGAIYTSDLQNTVKSCYPVSVDGLPVTPLMYGVSITSPAASSTAITLGRVPVYVGPPAISAAIDDGIGGVQITVSTTTGLVDGDSIQIYNVEGLEGGSGDWLTGTWVIDVISATAIDLVGSVFPVSGAIDGASLSAIIVTVVS